MSNVARAPGAWDAPAAPSGVVRGDSEYLDVTGSVGDDFEEDAWSLGSGGERQGDDYMQVDAEPSADLAAHDQLMSQLYGASDVAGEADTHYAEVAAVNDDTYETMENIFGPGAR